jgi:lipopolysaccharide transport system permease protein
MCVKCGSGLARDSLQQDDEHAAVPQFLQPIYSLNPIGSIISIISIIKALRAAIAGASINWITWAWALLITLLVFNLGYRFFEHSRDEFPDAL